MAGPDCYMVVCIKCPERLRLEWIRLNIENSPYESNAVMLEFLDDFFYLIIKNQTFYHRTPA